MYKKTTVKLFYLKSYVVYFIWPLHSRFVITVESDPFSGIDHEAWLLVRKKPAMTDVLTNNKQKSSKTVKSRRKPFDYIFYWMISRQQTKTQMTDKTQLNVSQACRLLYWWEGAYYISVNSQYISAIPINGLASIVYTHIQPMWYCWLINSQFTPYLKFVVTSQSRHCLFNIWDAGWHLCGTGDLMKDTVCKIQEVEKEECQTSSLSVTRF